MRVPRVRRRWLCSVLVAWLPACGPGVAASEPRTREIARFFEPFKADQVALSRDGRQLACVAQVGATLKVTLVAVDDWAKAEVPIGNPAGARVQTFEWADADLLLLVTEAPAYIVVDTRTRLARLVLDADSFAVMLENGVTVPRQPRFVGLAVDEPACVLVQGSAPYVPPDGGGFVQMPHEQARADFETVKLNLRTGARSTVAVVTEERTAGFVHDRRGHPRVLHQRHTLPQLFRHRLQGAAQILGGWMDLDRLVGGGGLGFAITPQNFHGQRSFPLCFGAEPDVLYYASNVGRETMAIFSLDLRTKARAEIAAATVDLAESAQTGAAGPLVFDRASGRLAGVRADVLTPATRWLDPEIARVQSELEAKFPGRRVQIVQWDDARARFLALISSPDDPGRYFVHHRSDGRCVEFLRRASWFRAEAAHAVEAFDFQTPAGVRIAGRLTLPRATRIAVPPLLVYGHDGPGRTWSTEFDREAQALASMGCIVLQLEPRGSGGLGWRHAGLAADAFDRVPLEDTIAAIEWAAQRHRFDRRRVGIIGHGLGGYVALRALALEPKVFRCAIAINAPTSLEQLVVPSRAAEQVTRRFAKEFFDHTEALRAALDRELPPSRLPTMASAEAPPVVDFPTELTKWMFLRGGVRAPGASVLKHVAQITQPVMLIHDRTHRVVSISHPRALRQALRGQGTGVELMEVGVRFTRDDLVAREQVFQRMHEFLNAALYDFDVRIGPTKEVK